MTRKTTRPNRLPALLVSLLLLLSGVAFGHATIVIVDLSTTPQTPDVGEEFSIRIYMEDPTRVPVEDAFVLADFSLPGDEGEETGESLITRLFEQDEPGVYEGTISLPEAGSWLLLMRDQTYRQEEAQATLSFIVGDGQGRSNPETRSFVFPPTATGGSSLGTWLVWLIGLPIAAGAAVTVLVLTGNKPQEGKTGPKTS
ncbi:MAG: FixH family protein [Trueperaceae bacterium]|nr:FixH family protein [Trueperaceae bacterium]